MSDYRVNLDVFAGPMDLLLYLVRKEEVDIYDIPIARITEQYIKYIEMLKSLDIDLAGDFLVMAATLMAIKSAMLLPKAGPDDIEAEDFEDPRAELIRQLLEYKKFKDAANLLDACAAEQQQRSARPGTIIDRLKEDTEPEVDMDNVSVWDLLGAFDNILQATGASFDVSHIHDDTPIDLYQIEILHRLQTDGAMPFERIFAERDNRLVLIGLFLAILELIKESLVAAEQQAGKGPIYLSALTDEPAETAVQKAIIASAEQAAESAAVPIVEIEKAPNSQEKIETLQTPQSSVPITEVPAEQKQRSSRQYSTPQQKDENNAAGN